MSQTNNLVEVYHFINPIGKICFTTEKEILDFANEFNGKVSIRFIPFVNMQTIQAFLEREGMWPIDLEVRNKVYEKAYSAGLAFHAASMQGKKFGRLFLLEFQKQVIQNGAEINQDLFLQIADLIGIDIEMFEGDLASDWVKKMFVADQRLAHEMDITETPSCIVYTNTNFEYGYLLRPGFTKQALHNLIADCSAKNRSILILKEK